jgi:hypothetical protein
MKARYDSKLQAISCGRIYMKVKLFFFGILKLFRLYVVCVKYVVEVVVTGQLEDFSAKFCRDSWSYL